MKSMEKNRYINAKEKFTYWLIYGKSNWATFSDRHTRGQSLAFSLNKISLYQSHCTHLAEYFHMQTDYLPIKFNLNLLSKEISIHREHSGVSSHRTKRNRGLRMPPNCSKGGRGKQVRNCPHPQYSFIVRGLFTDGSFYLCVLDKCSMLISPFHFNTLEFFTLIVQRSAPHRILLLSR